MLFTPIQVHTQCSIGGGGLKSSLVRGTKYKINPEVAIPSVDHPLEKYIYTSRDIPGAGHPDDM